MIEFEHKGDFKKAFSFLEQMKEVFNLGCLDKYGRIGVEELKKATPRDTGKTADSWYYKIERNKDSVVVYWGNTNQNDGYTIALLLQYGHGTGNGYYVQGIDYINPAMRDVFQNLADEAWKEVTGK